MIKEHAKGWKTSLTVDEAGIHGHPIAPDGRVQRETITLPASSPLLMHAESHVLHIHIPSGGKLDPAACRDSLVLAREFFPRHFPEKKWAGLCCHAWLLDPALEIILPADSNLRAFAKMFRPLPASEAEESSYLYRVFGKHSDRQSAGKMPRKTVLQQAVLDHMNAGGILRAGAGYIVI